MFCNHFFCSHYLETPVPRIISVAETEGNRVRVFGYLFRGDNVQCEFGEGGPRFPANITGKFESVVINISTCTTD